MISLRCWLITIAFTCHASGSPAGDVANAARSGDVEALIRLLDGGAPADEPGVANPLHFAVMAGHTDAAGVLLERGADPDADSALGTPLMVAAGRKRLELVELLLSNNADPNIAGGRNGRMPLHAAAFSGATDVVQMLLDHGADPMARTKYGEPPLHLALQKNHAETAELLRAKTNWSPPQPPTEADIAKADIGKGQEAALLCNICHPLEAGMAAKGPTLWNVVGRPVANLEDYPYSKAMRAAGGTWDIATLDAFLVDPRMAMPGNMMVTGVDRLEVTDRDQRWAIIAYLQTLK